jgi:YD repeat-containing protein
LGTYFKTDIDSVSLTNGNLHLHIPLFSLPGRELPVSIAMDYDSQFFERRYLYTNGSGQAVYGFESLQWRKGGGLLSGTITASRGITQVGTYFIRWMLTFVWGSPAGRRYTFQKELIQSCSSVGGYPNYTCSNASPPDNQIYDNLTVNSADSEFTTLLTGTYFSSGYSTPATIVLKDGTRLSGGFATQYNPTTMTTTNGNYLWGNNSTVGVSNLNAGYGDPVPTTDTLGRAITYSNTGSGTFYPPETFTLQDANGQPQVYRIDWTKVYATIPAYLESSGYAVDDDFKLVSAITLPNGKAYTFEYNTEGMLSKVTLPSGAYIRYQYAHPGNSMRAHVTSRWVSHDGTAASEKQTSYSYTFAPPNLGPIQTTTVTDPLGTVTRHDFYTSTYWMSLYLAHVETTTTVISPTNQVVQRIDRTWQSAANGSTWGFPQLASATTTMPDVVRKTQYTYDANNNVTRVEDFDWGVGSPGARLRYVDKTYLATACTSDHICNRVTSEKIYTDAGLLVAQTDQEYDNYSGSNALVTRTGTIPGWISPTGTRANVTAVKRWVHNNIDPDTWFVTTQQYDVLGNKVKVTDPGGHATETFFTDRFSGITGTNTFAYPTRVTEPSVFYVETTYDFNTGLVKQTTDSLNRTTTKTYDAMNREVETDYPNGGFTKYCYNDPTPSAACYDATGISVRKQVKVDAAGNLGTVIAHYDGLYRETQKETYDPEGTIYVDTQYDAKGRKWKVSNPRRAAEAQVWTQFAYDALDRPTVTTAPDNSTVQNSYNGNQTMVIDQAGNQRRYTFDGLGQMTKVEEPNPSLATALVTTYKYNVLGKMKP